MPVIHQWNIKLLFCHYHLEERIYSNILTRTLYKYTTIIIVSFHLEPLYCWQCKWSRLKLCIWSTQMHTDMNNMALNTLTCFLFKKCCRYIFINPFPATPAPIVPFSILLCLSDLGICARWAKVWTHPHLVGLGIFSRIKTDN